MTRFSYEDVTDERINDWRYFTKKTVLRAIRMNTPFTIRTAEGIMYGQAGDWLAEGVYGERYPIKDTVMHASYEEINVPEEGLD